MIDFINIIEAIICATGYGVQQRADFYRMYRVSPMIMNYIPEDSLTPERISQLFAAEGKKAER